MRYVLTLTLGLLAVAGGLTLVAAFRRGLIDGLEARRLSDSARARRAWSKRRGDGLPPAPGASRSESGQNRYEEWDALLAELDKETSMVAVEAMDMIDAARAHQADHPGATITLHPRQCRDGREIWH